MRKAVIERKTRETTVSVKLNVDGAGKYKIRTSIGFLTHMLESFAFHGMFDLELSAEGDLAVDQHHLMEDTGTALGQAFSKALGSRRGIARAGFFVYPMEEALAVTAVDISGRPF
ncbi:MAG: imidazoleglycerol-phosphate dehydratase, partial [Candidatus Diapherotrites archaeon]|nr:imidazoleglycerol-phosphate dehydratase [Candidatus Diapherotrites archaeon]